MKKNSYWKDQLDDIKQYGYLNHIAGFFFVLFFLFISKELPIEFNLFGCIYWYVVSLMMGHFAIHNVNNYKGKKWKYKKVKNDTYGAIPIAGAINILTYGIPILVIDYFFKIL